MPASVEDGWHAVQIIGNSRQRNASCYLLKGRTNTIQPVLPFAGKLIC